MKHYRKRVAGASTGTQRVILWVNRVFEKIIDVVKKAIQWLLDQAKAVIDILEMIQMAFNEFTESLCLR